MTSFFLLQRRRAGGGEERNEFYVPEPEPDPIAPHVMLELMNGDRMTC